MLKKQILPQLKVYEFNTPLGLMTAIGDESFIYFIDFSDNKALSVQAQSLERGTTPVIMALEQELQAYFKGELLIFKTPLFLQGSSFQKKAWQTLRDIPYGQTISYQEQATILGKPNAYRAVANANGANRHIIVTPCHRVINKNGGLGGYSSGLDKKIWLLAHERSFVNSNHDFALSLT